MPVRAATTRTATVAQPAAPRPAVSTPPPPVDAFTSAAQRPIDLGRLVKGLLARPPTLTAERVADELRGPRGHELASLLAAELPARSSELAPLLLAAPDRWGHPVARALLDATRFDPARERAVFEALAGLVRRGAEPAGWAGHFLVEREAEPFVAELARDGHRAVVGALVTRALSSEPEPAPRRAIDALLAAGQRVPPRAAERYGAALAKSFYPRASVDALVKQAAAGDGAALTALLTAAKGSAPARGALRDVFDATASPQLRAQLAPHIERWSDFATEQDFERALSGARLGEPAAIEALAKELSFAPSAKQERQRAAATALGELARKGSEPARRALGSLETAHGATAELIDAKAASVRTPAEARALLDGLEVPLRWGAPAVLSAAARAAARFPDALGAEHQQWLLDGLRGQSLRTTDVPIAGAVASLLGAVPGLRQRLVAGLDTLTAPGVVAVLGRAKPGPSSDELEAVGRLAASATGPALQAAARLLFEHRDRPEALSALASRAFDSLTADERRAVVDRAVATGRQAPFLECVPASRTCERLAALGGEYQAALAQAIAAAPEGSDLRRLGDTLGALQLATRPEYAGRIDVAAAQQKIAELTGGRLAGTLDALRAKVSVAKGALIDAQAAYVESLDYELRARLLPPEQRAAFVQQNTAALALLSPDKGRELTAKRFDRLPAQVQSALLANDPSLRAEISAFAKLASEPGSKLAAVAKGRLAHALDHLNAGLSLLAVDPANGWSLLDAGKDLAQLGATAVEGMATRAGSTLLGKAAATAGGALALYDVVKAGVQAADELGQGDTVGGLARIGSGTGSLGMIAGAALAASNPVGWVVLGAGAATWLGSEVVDLLYGETDTETRLRQLGVLLR